MLGADALKNFRSGYGFLNQELAAQGADYEDWKAKHILTCGKKWPTEIPDFRAIYYLNRAQNRDQAYIELYLQTAMAYLARKFILNPELEVRDTFIFSKLKAVKAIQDRLLRTLGEPNLPPSREVFEKFTREFPVLDPETLKHPMVVVFELRKMGVNPAGQFLAYNGDSDFSGQPPILKAPFPALLNEESSDYFVQNRKIAIQILEHCGSVYRNLHISNAVVAKGPCGSPK